MTRTLLCAISAAVFAMGLGVSAPATAWDIGRLAPLAGLDRQQQPSWYPRAPTLQQAIPDGFGGYTVYQNNRRPQLIQPDGFGGFNVWSR
jgi:hypothetical protein